MLLLVELSPVGIVVRVLYRRSLLGVRLLGNRVVVDLWGRVDDFTRRFGLAEIGA